jgi:hypothetical protein
MPWHARPRAGSTAAPPLHPFRRSPQCMHVCVTLSCQDGFALHDPLGAPNSVPQYIAGQPYRQEGQVGQAGRQAARAPGVCLCVCVCMGIPTDRCPPRAPKLQHLQVVGLCLAQVRLNDGRCDRRGRFVCGGYNGDEG